MRALFLSSAPIHRKTITRVEGVLAQGGTVAVAGFARENFEDRQALTYPVASLGFVRNGDLAGRALAAPLHWWRALRTGRRLPGCDTIWANSLDMLLLALAVRPFLSGRQRIVYDVADLTPNQLAGGWVGGTLRALERLGCRSVGTLVLTSPWFWQAYYRDVAPRAQVLLLENKVSAPAPAVSPTPAAPPWRIVWHGQLRCRTSLRVVLALAKALPTQVEVHAWGAVLDRLREEVADADANIANFTHHGPYSDVAIAPVFAGAHFIFGYDVDEGLNSRLLLSNRLYHGVARALPVLAVAGTAVGRVVEEQALGKAFDVGGGAAALIAFFKSLTLNHYEDMRAAIAAERRAAAVYSDDFARLVRAIESGVRIDQSTEHRHVVLGRQVSAELASPAYAFARTASMQLARGDEFGLKVPEVARGRSIVHMSNNRAAAARLRGGTALETAS